MAFGTITDVKANLPSLIELVTERKPGALAGKIHIANDFDKLPIHHKDPFDRLLISQTISEEMILVTVDEDIKKYDISVA